MRLLASMTIACCGCNTLIGIEDLPHDEPPDGITIRGQLAHRSIQNELDGSGLDVSVTAQPPTSVVFHFADGTSAATTSGADGSFEVIAPDAAPYRLEIPSQRRDFIMFLQGPNEVALLTTTGRYANASVPTAPPMTVDWDQVAFLGAQGYLDATKGDRLYLIILVYEGGQFVPRKFYVGEPTITATTQNATLHLQQLSPPVDCRTLSFNARSDDGRLGSVVGARDGNDQRTSQYTFDAVPASDYNVLQHLRLAGAAITGPMEIAAREVEFRNPFPGTDPILQTAVCSRYEPIDKVEFDSCITHIERLGSPHTDCSTAIERGETAIAVAGIPSIDGTLLATDDQPIAITETSKLTWPVASVGPTDKWDVVFFEAASKTIARSITIAGDIRELALDPAWFTEGKYIVLVSAVKGWTGPSEFTYPYDYSGIYSNTFVIE